MIENTLEFTELSTPELTETLTNDALPAPTLLVVARFTDAPTNITVLVPTALAIASYPA